jgi:hypothetical protein
MSPSLIAIGRRGGFAVLRVIAALGGKLQLHGLAHGLLGDGNGT